MSCCALKAQHSEALLKAVFFERFSRFIDWPTDVSPGNTFKIATIGQNSNVIRELKRIYAQQKIQDKKVEIINLDSIDQIVASDCQILFITSDMSKDIEKINAIAKKHHILTIGDTKNYAKRGVMINFHLRGESIRFTINESAAKKAGFYISYHLMQIADAVLDTD